MKRPTIRDIARLAQVSPGAVSLALNGKPGVSEATRQRIVEIAEAKGWTASQAARALSKSKADAVGLVLARPQASIDSERFYFQFICGMIEALTQRGQSLVLQIVDNVALELEVYRAWWTERRVDSVVLVDPLASDPRPDRLRELSLPFVSVGAGFDGGKAVLIDDGAIVEAALEHLAEQGCQRIGYVCGISNLEHSQVRQRTFMTACTRWGMEARMSNPTDYSELSGARELELLLSAPVKPDAVIFDNESLLLGGLPVLSAQGLAIPHDLAVLALEDSPVGKMVTPPVTAFDRDPSVLGAAAVALLIDADAPNEKVMETPHLITRGSTLRRVAS
ncbi:MAG: LacI family DNA-binding transcriptional regulator [Propionibacteriaceae bacterium]|nr:LacI family DNA-binding transcriptional regulator [Propionibacteriaceae bacterium]